MHMQNCPRWNVSRRSLRGAVLAGTALWLGAGAAVADESDVLNIYLQQSFVRDNNLFRLPDDVDPFGDGQRDDAISVSTASGRFDKKISLQRLYAEATAIRTNFSEYSYLDYTAVNGTLAWYWALASRWSGTLSGTQREMLRNFADSGGTEQSINTYQRYLADANYWLHAEWAVGVGAVRVTSRYSDDASANSEYDEDTVEGKITYRNVAQNQLALVYSQLDGSYPNESVPATADSDYRQRSLQLRAEWKASGASKLSGYVGSTDREYSNLPERDFSGFTGRLSYDWSPGEKLTINFLARREIGAEADLVDNFVVTKAAAITPTWAITPKVALAARAEVQRRDYGGDPGFAAVSGADKDNQTRVFGASASYAPMANLKLMLSVQQEDRDSDDTTREYDARVVSVSAQLSW